MVRLFARVGGASGRFDLPKSTVDPSRETFLSMLSSMACPATIDGDESDLYPVRARDYIQRMRSQHISTRDDSFLPDTMVYNAPIRWSGGHVSRDARPYAQPIARDRYHEDIFRDGFQSLQSAGRLVVVAEAMESWLCDMEHSDSPCCPDTEAYESVIQAWIRTGTLHGLQKAETLANRVFEPSTSLQPRLQTLHPILSAWIYSGTKDGASKVVEWVDRCVRATDATMGGRLLGAKLLADVSFQKRQLELSNQVGSGGSSHRSAESGIVLERAQSCSQQNEQLHLEADSFLLSKRGVMQQVSTWKKMIRMLSLRLYSLKSLQLLNLTMICLCRYLMTIR